MDTFTTTDGLQLHTTRWTPESTPRGVLVIVHGLGEHIGRYDRLGLYFARQGMLVAGYDQRGFGRSEGRRAYVDPFDAFTGDLDEFLGRVRADFPDLPLFLFGHSMGGLVAAAYALDWDPARHGVRGLILSSPALGTREAPFLQKIAGVLGRTLPRLKTVALDLDALSHDPAVADAVRRDPLFYRGRLHARTGANLLAAMRRVQAEATAFTLPFLLTHGEADRLTDPVSSQQFFERAGAQDKTLRLFPGLYHETFNEPESQPVLECFTEWLVARCA